ncbi:MAG: type II secretion system protein GspG [Planctomycetes bacterium]|nr:type II secretion system protein GspG [Planctomycetota bacterium]
MTQLPATLATVYDGTADTLLLILLIVISCLAASWAYNRLCSSSARAANPSLGRRIGRVIVKMILASFFMAVLSTLVIYLRIHSARPDPLRIARVASWIHSLRAATQLYHLDHGAFPPSGNIELVKALSNGPKIPYWDFTKDDWDSLDSKGQVVDSWRTPIVYRSNAKSFTLYSAGPNQHDDGGSSDDITSDY